MKKIVSLILYPFALIGFFLFHYPSYRKWEKEELAEEEMEEA